MKESIQKKIEEEIAQKKEGEVFSILDFLTYGNYEAVKKVLIRIEMKGFIARIINGLYYKKGKRIVMADMNDIAHAIARKFNWTIAPSGERCLFFLGLEEKDEKEWVFLSSGPYREYEINRERIRFRHTTHRDIIGLSPVSAVVVTAIKTIKRERITSDDMRTIRNFLSLEDRSILLSECHKCTSWVYKSILKICL